MQCKEDVHVHVFFSHVLHCFPMLMLPSILFVAVCNKVQLYLMQSQHIKSSRTKRQKEDLWKQHGITDVENALLHLLMNLHRYAYHSVYIDILISAG